MRHYLNEYYKYWNDPQKFKLMRVEGFIYVFACGHRVTDNVFCDMVRVKTGEQNYKATEQLQLL